MKSNRYLALLRGINVGGNNIIKMTDLKSSFEKMGYSDVITYIQSGNVLFSSAETDQDKICSAVEKHLSEEFNYKSKVVIINSEEMKTVIKEIPSEFGADPDKFRYDVIFFKNPMTPESVLPEIKLRDGVDTASSGTYTLYFSRLISKAGQSYLKNIMVLPAYKQMTIRNWNTTRKLFELM